MRFYLLLVFFLSNPSKIQFNNKNTSFSKTRTSIKLRDRRINGKSKGLYSSALGKKGDHESKISQIWNFIPTCSLTTKERRYAM